MKAWVTQLGSVITENAQRGQQQDTTGSEETGQDHSPGEWRRVKGAWPFSGSHLLGPLAGNPVIIMETLTQQESLSDCVPEHMKDTLVTPEILKGLIQGLLDLLEKEIKSQGDPGYT